MNDESIQVLIGIGANLGDALSTVQSAIASLSQKPGLRVLRISSPYRSAPVQAQGPWYVNAVVELAVNLSAHALLQTLQSVELSYGRERRYRNAPRTLDLDILFYGQACIESKDLSVPHPRWKQRMFVLAPLFELAYHELVQPHWEACRTQTVEQLKWPSHTTLLQP